MKPQLQSPPRPVNRFTAPPPLRKYPTKTDFMRWLSDHPPTAEPTWIEYEQNRKFHGGVNSLAKPGQFGCHCYTFHKVIFARLYEEFLNHPERWEQ